MLIKNHREVVLKRLFNKLTGILLSVLMIVMMIPMLPSEASCSFKDVFSGDWFFDSVQYVSDKGLMKGMSEDTFEPQTTMSRAMAVTVLHRMEGGQISASPFDFKDVPPNSWFADSVAWAAADGIVNGYNADIFGPYDDVTREQIAVILYRYADKKGFDVSRRADLSGFNDVNDISDWAEDALAWANAEGLVVGLDDKTLAPGSKTTRAQVATVIKRMNEWIINPNQNTDENARILRMMDSMSMEQKITQMIMPAIRKWDGENVTDLSKAPGLKEAPRRHQYGGIILFGQNIVDSGQTVRLISDLQVNNAQSDDAQNTGVIPYLISADQEGGSVARLSMGTRGTGSMAIGATGEKAEDNARETGQIFGEELEALGINVNLGPCIDVIGDLTDSGMSTRVYSDDPEIVTKLGLAFADGIGQSNVITTYKHFPGAGDGSDYPTSIPLTLDQLRENGLLSYASVIESGADMVMTSATTFPAFDDEQLMADGVTKGYYPATLSYKIVTGILREELGFDGVVITDALEMDQFVTEPDNGKALFTGDSGTVGHALQVAEKAINAGCDILLIPTDLDKKAAVNYYDDYINGIVKLVEDGSISVQRIDESVERILTLKERHGVLDMDTSGEDVVRRIGKASLTVGSTEHHVKENDIAQQAVTLLKDDGVLPVAGKGSRITIACRSKLDNTPVIFALNRLIADGVIDKDAKIENHITGETMGDRESETVIMIDSYYDTSNGQLSYSNALTSSIGNSDVVICLCAVGAGIDQLQDDNPVMQGVRRALDETHKAGAEFVLLSDNLPVDASRFQDADSIVCAYLSSGFGIDPTARTSGSENVGAFNANVPAALIAIFGAADMPGRLPVNIPVLEKSLDGKWSYSDRLLYERGYSILNGK